LGSHFLEVVVNNHANNRALTTPV